MNSLLELPTPIEIALDPVSLAILALYGGLLLWETLAPGRELPRVAGWRTRGLAVFAVGPIIQACALEHTPRAVWGSAQSFMDIARALLSLAFPLIGGSIADSYGLSYAFYLMGTVNLLGALIILAVPAPGVRDLRLRSPELATELQSP